MKKEEQSFGCGISVSQKGHALSGWILRIVPLFAMLFAGQRIFPVGNTVC